MDDTEERNTHAQLTIIAKNSLQEKAKYSNQNTEFLYSLRETFFAPSAIFRPQEII